MITRSCRETCNTTFDHRNPLGDQGWQARILFWARHIAAVLTFLLVLAVALAAGLLIPYFLAAPRQFQIRAGARR
jgi:hypothetical protein